MTTNTKPPIDRTIRDILSACKDLDMQLEEIEDSTRRAQRTKEDLENTLQDLENTLQDLKSISQGLAAASQLAVYETDLATYIHEHRSSMDYRTERMFEQLFNIVRLAPATFA